MAVKVVIGAIWPSFYTLHNTLPESSGIELNTFIGLIIFAAVSYVLLLIPPERYRKPFVVGSVLITITVISIFIWALAKEGGGGPLLSHPSELSGVVPLSGGSNIGWCMAYGVSAIIGGISAGIMNMSDFTAFASYPRAQIVSQVVAAPAVMIISALIGMIVTSCAAGFYPDEPLVRLGPSVRAGAS